MFHMQLSAKCCHEQGYKKHIKFWQLSRIKSLRDDITSSRWDLGAASPSLHSCVNPVQQAPSFGPHGPHGPRKRHRGLRWGLHAAAAVCQLFSWWGLQMGACRYLGPVFVIKGSSLLELTCGKSHHNENKTNWSWLCYVSPGQGRAIAREHLD